MGFITEAQEEEIRQRRAKVGEEEDRLKAIQQSREADNLDQWKSARDSGAIKTASSGLKRRCPTSTGAMCKKRRRTASPSRRSRRALPRRRIRSRASSTSPKLQNRSRRPSPRRRTR